MKKTRFKSAFFYGAGNRNRTGDLVITNDVLYRLSHTSTFVIISNKTAFVNIFSKNAYSLYFFPFS